MGLIFVDCEAVGRCPRRGELTEFGAVDYDTYKRNVNTDNKKWNTFHGVLAEAMPDPANHAISRIVGARFDPKEVFTKFADWLKQFKGRAIMVSDNPAYDFQWINDGFEVYLGHSPFGHSARRISDYYAGLLGDFSKTQEWKRLRITLHDHNPVHDAMGNVEAFYRLEQGER